MPLLDATGLIADDFRDAAGAPEGWTGGLLLDRDGSFPNGFSGRRGLVLPGEAKAEEAFATAQGFDAIAITFPVFSDGRGFTLARRLRRLGWAGHLRTRGPLLPDQLVMALACGFDAVEIAPELLDRHGLESWLAAPRLQRHRYQRNQADGLGVAVAQRLEQLS